MKTLQVRRRHQEMLWRLQKHLVVVPHSRSDLPPNAAAVQRRSGAASAGLTMAVESKASQIGFLVLFGEVSLAAVHFRRGFCLDQITRHQKQVPPRSGFHAKVCRCSGRNRSTWTPAVWTAVACGWKLRAPSGRPWVSTSFSVGRVP